MSVFPPVKKTEIARITASFDCGLQILADVPAFYHGTSPNKFFDYISSGIPVINNYPGWLAELINREACGAVVPVGSPSALAEELIRLAADPKLCATLGRNARTVAEQEFDRKLLATRWVEVMEESGEKVGRIK